MYTRIAFLLAIVGCILTSTAYADFNSNLSLEIVNVDSGSGVVINSTDTTYDHNNISVLAPGYIQGNFQLLNLDGSTTTGNFVVALSDVDANQATLTLAMNIQANGAANIQITIKDDAYNVPDTTTTTSAGFSATLTNYTSLHNDLFPILGGSAQVAPGGTASFNSWMNTADQTPALTMARIRREPLWIKLLPLLFQRRRIAL